jgi:hypothetical protein
LLVVDDDLEVFRKVIQPLFEDFEDLLSHLTPNESAAFGGQLEFLDQLGCEFINAIAKNMLRYRRSTI